MCIKQHRNIFFTLHTKQTEKTNANLLADKPEDNRLVESEQIQTSNKINSNDFNVVGRCKVNVLKHI